MRSLFPCLTLFLWAVTLGAAAAEPETPATPDSLIALIAAAGDSTDWPDAAAIAVLDRTVVDVEETGLGHVRNRELMKVLTEGGALSLATQRFDYDPASNFIRVESVKIHRADGTTESVSPAAAVDLPAPAYLIYWGARMKILSLPRLHVGDAVDIETYKKGFQIAYLQDEAEMDDERYIPPMRGHFYDVVTFQDMHPIKEKSYELRVPRDKPVQYAVYNGPLSSSLRFGDGTLVYSWEDHDIPAFESESRTPDLTDLVPKVVLATVEDWPEKSRWFFEVNEAQFEANDAIRRKVAELTAGMKDDDEKMAVLLHWVAQEIRYSGLSMGKGEGYTLHTGIMDFEDRAGVCKDIAGMLVTMLRVAGYTTYPVMTMAGSRVESIPADQFNHCVVAVENPDGSFTMLDPTWAPFNRAVWSRWEGEQHFVIGSPSGEELMQMRSFTPEESRMRVESQASIDADGTLHGEMTLNGVGISDGRIRRGLSGARAGETELFLADLLGSLGPAVEITGYKAIDPRDFSRDAEIQFTYEVPQYAAVGESLLTFIPPGVRVAAHHWRVSRLLAFTDGEDRQHDALLWAAQEAVVHEQVKLPNGMRTDDEVESTSLDSEAASFSSLYSPEGGRVKVEMTATVKKRTVPAQEWAGGVEAADSLRAFGSRPRWARRGR